MSKVKDFLNSYAILFGVVALVVIGGIYKYTHDFSNPATSFGDIDITHTKYTVIDSASSGKYNNDEWYKIFTEKDFISALKDNDTNVINNYITSSMLVKYKMLLQDIRYLKIDHSNNTNEYKLTAQCYDDKCSFSFVLDMLDNGKVLLCADDLVNADSPIEYNTSGDFTNFKGLRNTLLPVDGVEVDCNDIYVYTDATQTSGYSSEAGLYNISESLQEEGLNTGITYLRQYKGKTKDADYLNNFGRLIIDFSAHRTDDVSYDYYAKVSSAIYNLLCDKYGCDRIFNVKVICRSNTTVFFIGKNIFTKEGESLTADTIKESLQNGYSKEVKTYKTEDKSNNEQVKTDEEIIFTEEDAE